MQWEAVGQPPREPGHPPPAPRSPSGDALAPIKATKPDARAPAPGPGPAAMLFEAELGGHPAKDQELQELRELGLSHCFVHPGGADIPPSDCVPASCPCGTLTLHLPPLGGLPAENSGGGDPVPVSLVPSTEPAHSRLSINVT